MNAQIQSARLGAKPSFQTRVKRSVAASRAAVPTRKVTTAFSDINAAVAGATTLSLSLGRFVFLPYHRAQLTKAGLPVQNGQTHSAAGDNRAIEASGVLKTNDPAGFNIVDVFAWGAIGHAIGFSAVASQGFFN